MPRAGSNVSIQEIIEESVAGLVATVCKSIDRLAARMVAEELEKRKAPSIGRRAPRRTIAPPRRASSELTRWVADRRARRVPTFVIEMTGGLDTKKKIVAKYGENVVFEKGKPLPKPARAA